MTGGQTGLVGALVRLSIRDEREGCFSVDGNADDAGELSRCLQEDDTLKYIPRYLSSMVLCCRNCTCSREGKECMKWTDTACSRNKRSGCVFTVAKQQLAWSCEANGNGIYTLYTVLVMGGKVETAAFLLGNGASIDLINTQGGCTCLSSHSRWHRAPLRIR